MNNIQSYEEIIRKCFFQVLKREPDYTTLYSFLDLFVNKKIDESELISKLKNSIEYKISHPTDLHNLSAEELMKTDWDERARIDEKFAIRAVLNQKEEEFWKSGKDDCISILGIGTKTFELISNGKNPKNMKVLEIGCGIGRILIPMANIFGEVVGIDVSHEMVNSGKKYIERIPKCKIFETNGSDLSILSSDYFDFCYSFIVFQHIPEKEIVKNYIKEISRVLKKDCIFIFQVRGNINTKPRETNTWDGVRFSSNEMHQFADDYNFEILKETDDNKEYYWLTFKSIK